MTAMESTHRPASTAAITLVTPGYPPSTGGVEAHSAALAGELTRRGIDVEVLTARRGLRRVTTEFRDGARVVTYPAWHTRALSISPRLLIAALGRRRSGRLMHVHSYHATTALAVLGPRARTVFTPHYHGTRGHSPAADLLHRGFYHVAKVLMRRCDAVICVSRAERELLIRDFPTVADKVCVIPNGVAAEAVRAASPYDDEQPTICCVGRLERYKRVEDIVRAFADVPPPARLVIIGEGPARQELESLVNELELDDRITLTGAIPDGVLHRWLRTASVFVSLSQREAFGMAPLEAAAAGARIILSDIAAHREIAAEYLGSAAVLLSDPTPRAVAVEIVRQLSLTRPPRASVPSWDDVAARTVGIYASFTATPAPTVHARNASHPTKEYT